MSYKYLILNCLLIFLSLSNALPLTKEKNEVKYRPGIYNLKNSLGSVNIIGGNTSDITEHPYQVAVLVNGTFIGSGIILNKNWVATLASFLDNIESKSKIVLSAGNTDYKKGKILKVQKVVIHPSFDSNTLNNDVALLKLSKSIKKFTKKIRPISIDSKPLSPADLVFVSGWGVNESIKGVQESTIYKETVLYIVDQISCSIAYQPYVITDTMICAYQMNTGPCWGDFGDVLTDYKKKYAYGLFSWSKGCAEGYYPNVFTDLVSLKEWIQSIIKKGIQENSSVNESETDKQDNNLKIKENNDNEKSALFDLKNLNDGVNRIKGLFLKNQHLLSKRSVDLFLDVNEDNKKIEEEDEEANADEEEEKQEKEEDDAEQEATKSIKEKRLNENFNGEDDDVNVNEKLEEEEETRPNGEDDDGNENEKLEEEEERRTNGEDDDGNENKKLEEEEETRTNGEDDDVNENEKLEEEEETRPNGEDDDVNENEKLEEETRTNEEEEEQQEGEGEEEDEEFKEVFDVKEKKTHEEVEAEESYMDKISELAESVNAEKKMKKELKEIGDATDEEEQNETEITDSPENEDINEDEEYDK